MIKKLFQNGYFGLFFAAILFYLFYFSGSLIYDLISPFRELNDRVKLLSYINYLALVACLPLLILFFYISITRIIGSYNSKTLVLTQRVVFFIVLPIAILSIIPRYYLGYKVEQAGYVKCEKESRTSSKSSWRIYAKSPSLCKNSWNAPE